MNSSSWRSLSGGDRMTHTHQFLGRLHAAGLLDQRNAVDHLQSSNLTGLHSTRADPLDGDPSTAPRRSLDLAGKPLGDGGEFEAGVEH